MQNSMSMIRCLFALLCVSMVTTYAIALGLHGAFLVNLLIGIGSGIALTLAILSLEPILKRIQLLNLSMIIIGLLLGYTIAQALIVIFSSITESNSNPFPAQFTGFFTLVTLLTCSYISMMITSSLGDYISLKFHPAPTSESTQSTGPKKDLLLDTSILLDPRLIDVAASGIIDQRVVLPSFIMNEVNVLAEHGDENTRIKGKRAQELIKKLEALPFFELDFSTIDFPETKDVSQKLIDLARKMGAHILTADLNRILQPQADDVRWININFLANALKPLTQTGEIISIKIQRFGKEPRQGVGYLEDGTMVVVNSGAEFIGETIQAQVLSVKHTSSGRMIFCNALEDVCCNGNPTDGLVAADLSKKPAFDVY